MVWFALVLAVLALSGILVEFLDWRAARAIQIRWAEAPRATRQRMIRDRL